MGDCARRGHCSCNLDRADVCEELADASFWGLGVYNIEPVREARCCGDDVVAAHKIPLCTDGCSGWCKGKEDALGVTEC